MEKIARFYKVSYEQFCKDWIDVFGNDCNCKSIYDNIKLPKRATVGSAGYDFYIPLATTILAEKTAKIPTGIRVEISQGWVLNIYPRSSLGFKYRLQLDNTVGIIDSDYFGAANEGHIFIKITNCCTQDKTINLATGEAFAQGVFMQFGITIDDECENIRVGGMGSTNCNKV